MKPVGDPTLAPPGPSAEAAQRRFLRSAPDTVPRVPSASGHRMFHQPSGLSAYCRSPAVRRDVPPRMRKHSGFPAWRRPSHPLWRGQLWVRRSADDPERHPCIYRCRGTVPPVPRRLPLRMPPRIRGIVQPFPSGAGQPSDTLCGHSHFPGHVRNTANPSPFHGHFSLKITKNSPVESTGLLDSAAGNWPCRSFYRIHYISVCG